MPGRREDFGSGFGLSRKMEFEELISVLTAEHAEMKKDLADVKQAIAKRDFSSASKILRELDRMFKQHIADEEAQVLRILIDAYGVEGADDAIKVFRQRRIGNPRIGILRPGWRPFFYRASSRSSRPPRISTCPYPSFIGAYIDHDSIMPA
jgi:hypothetical protein